MVLAFLRGHHPLRKTAFPELWKLGKPEEPDLRMKQVSAVLRAVSKTMSYLWDAFP